jgi:hypothetical protein
MAGFVFNEAAESLLDGSINWGSDTIRVRPVATSESLDKDATAMTSIGVTGYDQTLGSKTRTKDTTNDRIVYDAADPTFPSVAAGAEVNRMVAFKFVTNDADSIPIAVVDITAITPNGGNIAVTIAATGLFYTQQ